MSERGTNRFQQLPEPVRLEDVVTSQEASPPPDLPTLLQEQHRLQETVG